ncbi:hypothetical protein OROMI_007738 [Orobanche minor]
MASERFKALLLPRPPRSASPPSPYNQQTFDPPYRSRGLPPAYEYVIYGKYNDEDLRDLFMNGDTRFQLRFNKLEKLYLPLNDTKGHWFVAIIEFDFLKIIVCDTKPNNMMKAFAKDVVTQSVNKLGGLLGKGKLGNPYTYQYPIWVPNQENGYDYRIGLNQTATCHDVIHPPVQPFCMV